MKTKVLSILMAVAVLVGFSSCSDDNWAAESANAVGQLRTASLAVEVNRGENVVSDNTGALKAARSRDAIDLSGFLITVTNNTGEAVANWTYKDMPELPSFPVGSYTLTVRSGEVAGAAWNAPYYEGAIDFEIKANEISDLGIVTCKLANIRVSVNFTQELLNASDNGRDIKVVVRSKDERALTFTPTETRSGYFEALEGLTTLQVSFSGTIFGSEESFTKAVEEVAKGQHRVITFGLSSNPALPPEEVGTITTDGGAITISTEVIDDAPIDKDYDWAEDNLDDKDRPGQEEPEIPVDPVDPVNPTDAIVFNSSELSLTGVNDASVFGPDPDDNGNPTGLKSAVVDITSENGLANLVVTIISDDLTGANLEGVGLTDKFDLAYPGQYEAALTGFGFPTGQGVIGKTSVSFDITKFVPLLTAFPGEHSFKIDATDSLGKQASLLLQFKAE